MSLISHTFIVTFLYTHIYITRPPPINTRTRPCEKKKRHGAAYTGHKARIFILNSYIKALQASEAKKARRKAEGERERERERVDRARGQVYGVKYEMIPASGGFTSR